MNTDHLILLCAWALFGILHSFLAADRVTGFFRKHMGRHFIYYRPIYSLIALGSLSVVLVLQFSIRAIYLCNFGTLKWLIALPTGCGGLILMGICIRKYFLNLTGINALLKKQPERLLTSEGIHRYVRHPLYLGTLVMIWSLLLFFPILSNLIACVMITIYTLIGIQLEEKKLLRRFGPAYAMYRKQTPMLIPGKFGIFLAGLG